ncbi:endolytic transglycosylase MltG [Candidatus Poribacteria bacterium]|nr:MAG: endolytic transglycosylase MltG [Candidatus Poribacteria bacterium]
MKSSDIRQNARWYISIALFSVSILSSLAILIAIFYTVRYLAPVDANAKPIQLKIVRGMSSQAIADQLARNDLIHNPWIFLFVTHFSDASHRLQVGTYRLSGAMTIPQIIDHLKTGKVVTRQFVVPEGLTVVQTGKLWEKSRFGTASAFNQAARDPKWLRTYRIEGKTLEGYLFPNTYQFPDGATPQVILEIMLDEFDQRWTAEFTEEAKALGFSKHEVITLASIIEAEARVPDERALVSAVFHNRLRRGWKLQADPTALYGLGNPDRPPRAADLRVDSPYNTYIHKGLPPGPICNPGMASILAALRPTSVDYMYFVAIGDGRHHFSKTLREHQNMINKIRRKRRLVAD